MTVSRIVLSFLAALLFCLTLRAGTDDPAKEITYSKDVAPILFKKCAVCHHANDIAPMSLMTYKEVRPWAMSIREKVVKREMPPWHADPKVGEFSNDARLSDAEIETIRTWVSTGAREGDSKDLPPVPVFNAGWHLTPDVVFSIPEHVISAGNQDDYQYFFIPTNFSEDRWVQATEVLPGDRRVVHHVNVNSISAGEALKALQKGSGSKTGGDGLHYQTGNLSHIRLDAPIVDDGCASPDGGGTPGQGPADWGVQPGIYLPGHLPETQPPGYAVKIPAGSYLRFDIHYSNRLGESVKDHTGIGLVFAKEPVTHEVALLDVENELFLIPPNAPDHRVTSCYTLPKPVIALALTAHMHFRGRSMMTEAVYPDGRRETLFNVPRYDFRWQRTYSLSRPKLLPKGTKLITTAQFDNSANNPLNPDSSKTVRWGEPSGDEMMAFWLQFADPQAADVKAAAARAEH